MKTYPVFRLTIFMAAGILFANTFWTGIGVVQLVCLLLLLLGMSFGLKTSSYGARWLFGAGASCFMFLVGGGTYFAFLKRTGLAKDICNIEDYQLLFPIPENEVLLNSSVKQNPGY